MMYWQNIQLYQKWDIAIGTTSSRYCEQHETLNNLLLKCEEAKFVLQTAVQTIN